MQTQLTNILAQIQTLQSNLANLLTQVTAGAQSPSVSGTTTAQSSGYKFYSPLSLGSSGADVTALQTLLAAKGYYTGSITGYYGTATMDAVMEYQTAHGITPLGNVGPATRAALNAE